MMQQQMTLHSLNFKYVMMTVLNGIDTWIVRTSDWAGKIVEEGGHRPKAQADQRNTVGALHMHHLNTQLRNIRKKYE